MTAGDATPESGLDTAPEADDTAISEQRAARVKELVRTLSGASAVGIAKACPVSPEAVEQYRRWTAAGRHGPMAYMTNHQVIRDDPRLLLDGAQSIIVEAFPYYHPEPQWRSRRRIARYARGEDYHTVIRSRLSRAAEAISAELGGAWRVCVDTAPIRERYWAVQAGLGFTGRNNTLIIPGQGSYFFLGEIITTLPLSPDAPCTLTCGDCLRCLHACPAGALTPAAPHSPMEGQLPTAPTALDARKCLSCLTIEHRGDFPHPLNLHGRIAGCDTCQEVCPHNAQPPTGLPEFAPANPLLTLSDQELEAAPPSTLKPVLKHSALSRIRPADLLRNISHS